MRMAERSCMPRHNLDFVATQRQLIESIVPIRIRDGNCFFPVGVQDRMTFSIQKFDANTSEAIVELCRPYSVKIIIDKAGNAPDAARGLAGPSHITIPKGTRDSVTIAKRAIIFHP